MIGLGPHELTVGLWAFTIGLTVALSVLATHAAVRATAGRPGQATRQRINPYPVPVVRADATRRGRLDDRGQASLGG